MKTDNEIIAEFMGLERAKANHDFFFIAEYHAYVSPENILYHKVMGLAHAGSGEDQERRS